MAIMCRSSGLTASKDWNLLGLLWLRLDVHMVPDQILYFGPET